MAWANKLENLETSVLIAEKPKFDTIEMPGVYLYISLSFNMFPWQRIKSNTTDKNIPIFSIFQKALLIRILLKIVCMVNIPLSKEREKKRW